MGKWIHRLSNKNLNKQRADCIYCGKNILIIKQDNIWKCKFGRMSQAHGNRGIYREKFRKYTKCFKCEIESFDIRFFDIHHINGDSDNNEIKNLQLLCPNCHRIETLKQWKEKRMKKWNKKFLNIN